MYGPLTSYLRAFFPTHRHFMIKPQAILRPEHDGEFLSDIGEQGSDDYQHRNADAADMLQLGGDDVDMPDDEEPEHNQDNEDDDAEDDGDKDVDDDDGDEEQQQQEDQQQEDQQEDQQQEDQQEDQQQEEQQEDNDAEDMDWDAGNTSFDSYGNPTKSRRIPGSKKGSRIPDFLVVKATETLTDDTLLLIVEVKKNSRTLTVSRLQMIEYLEMAAPKRRDPLLQGLLIVGSRTEAFYLDSGHHDAAPCARRGPRFHTTGRGLKQRIHNIAVQHW
ncbi:hypothetical protein BDZ97DRAFT_2086204 [Flammula alnicola]|nr:hypothetical protein BDZ97DRAFT_2086204 [Flammula alnicola]